MQQLPLAFNKQKSNPSSSGFSLLELLLAISIIAVIVLSSTRFFSTVMGNYKVAQVLQDIKIIRKATIDYCLDQPDYSSCLNPSSVANPPVLQTLYLAGLLPKNIADGISASPWKTNLQANPNRNQLQIIIACPIPANACQQLKNELQNQTIALAPADCNATAACSGASDNFVATFGDTIPTQK